MAEIIGFSDRAANAFVFALDGIAGTLFMTD